jgi:hypothetical protein
MDEKLKKIQKLLDAAEADLHTARSLMRQILELERKETIDTKSKAKDLTVLEEGKIVEGVFSGSSMVGADSKEYPIPANYASKSKLVEGDTLKLTIGDDGSFMYKQIAPIERRKVIGTLKQDDGSYLVNAEGKDYKVLQASITYYKGEPGDQVTIILPKDQESNWAAVENVIKRNVIGNKELSPPTEEKEITAKAEIGKADSQKSTGGNVPTIEYPDESKSKETFSKSDQNLIGNLKPKIDNPGDKTAIKKDSEEDDNQKVDQGIKELEI